MSDNSGYIKLLMDTLEKQVKTLEAILSVTKEQGAIAESDIFDENQFDDTLTRKDALIIQLNELDSGFVSIYDRVKKEIKDKPEDYKKEIVKLQELIRSCTDIGNEIQTLESRNRDKLSVCFAGKKQEYSAKQTAATVAGKYNVTMRNANMMNESYRFNQDK